MTDKKRLVIVGNGDMAHDLGASIDAADEVWRFNEPRDLAGKSGSKITKLFLCNSGKPMQSKLNNLAYLNSPFLKAVCNITFVYHPAIMRHYFKKPFFTARLLRKRKVDWTMEGIDVLGQLGKMVTIMPSQFYLAACNDIAIRDDDLYKKFPSTGYLALWMAIHDRSFQGWDVKLCGFGFEGWKRHQWDYEKEWVSARIQEGLLSFFE